LAEGHIHLFGAPIQRSGDFDLRPKGVFGIPVPRAALRLP